MTDPMKHTRILALTLSLFARFALANVPETVLPTTLEAVRSSYILDKMPWAQMMGVSNTATGKTMAVLIDGTSRGLVVTVTGSGSAQTVNQGTSPWIVRQYTQVSGTVSINGGAGTANGTPFYTAWTVTAPGFSSALPSYVVAVSGSGFYGAAGLPLVVSFTSGTVFNGDSTAFAIYNRGATVTNAQPVMSMAAANCTSASTIQGLISPTCASNLANLNMANSSQIGPLVTYNLTAGNTNGQFVNAAGRWAATSALAITVNGGSATSTYGSVALEAGMDNSTSVLTYSVVIGNSGGATVPIESGVRAVSVRLWHGASGTAYVGVDNVSMARTVGSATAPAVGNEILAKDVYWLRLNSNGTSQTWYFSTLELNCYIVVTKYLYP